MSKTIKQLVTELETAKAIMQKAKADVLAANQKVDDARMAVAVGESRLRATEAAFKNDPLGHGDALMEARSDLERRREALAALVHIHERQSAIHQEMAMSRSAQKQEARFALVKAIAAASVSDLDRKTIQRIRYAFAAMTIGDCTSGWGNFLARVIPQPTDAEMEVLRAEVVREFPVLNGR